MTAGNRIDPAYSSGGFLADFTATLAGVLLMIASLFDILQGGSAIANDELYSAGTEYLYRLDMTTWGWTHVVIGVLGVLVSVGILLRAGWGLAAGLVIAGLSILTNFMFLPAYPVWAAFIIGVNLIVIWALCTQIRSNR